MQNVLDRKADRAVDLMGDRRALFGGFRAADFGGGRLKENRIVKTLGVGERIGRGACRTFSRYSGARSARAFSGDALRMKKWIPLLCLLASCGSPADSSPVTVIVGAQLEPGQLMRTAGVRAPGMPV